MNSNEKISFETHQVYLFEKLYTRCLANAMNFKCLCPDNNPRYKTNKCPAYAKIAAECNAVNKKAYEFKRPNYILVEFKGHSSIVSNFILDSISKF